jgi:glutathione S-transferase
MSTTLRLYDLAGADERVRFSPNCWRVRLALAHKQLPVETVAWRFTEKDAIAFSGQGKVPVLVDGERRIADSWVIAEYLEDTYPDRPSLFGGTVGYSLGRFINQWTSEVLHPAIARVIISDLAKILHPKDWDYFRTTREKAFGTTFENLALAREANIEALHRVLQPLISTLAKQDFLAGVAPNYADHIAFGAFQWARVSSPISLFSSDGPVALWCERMLDAYGGLARATPAATKNLTPT